MGIFYSQPFLFLGAQQPLEGKKLTPPSGGGYVPPGSAIPAALMLWWKGPDPGPMLGGAQPYAPELLVPPQSGPTPQNPPFAGSAQPPAALASWWRPVDPPPPRPMGVIALLPPSASSYLPPGAAIPPPLLAWWAQAVWAPPQTVEQLTPPQGGPVAQNPPFAGPQVPAAITIAWLPATPPLWLGARQPYEPLKLTPGPQTSPYQPIGSALPPGLSAWWNVAATPPQPQVVIAPLLPTAAYQPVGPQIPAAMRLWWDRADPPAQRGSVIASLLPAVIVSNPPLLGTPIPPGVLISWLPPVPPVRMAPQPYEGRKLTPPSGPVAQNPPVLGSRVPVTLPAWWALVAPAYVPPAQLAPQPRWITQPDAGGAWAAQTTPSTAWATVSEAAAGWTTVPDSPL